MRQGSRLGEGFYEDKIVKKAKRQDTPAMVYTRLLEFEVCLLRALADMPIKFRNVLLPACQPALAEAIAVAVALKQAEGSADGAPEEIRRRLQGVFDSFCHVVEIALRMKALPEGRIALLFESLHKARGGRE